MAKVMNEKDLLEQKAPVVVTLEEYMLQEWVKMVDEEENKEKFIYTCKVIVISIDFQERSV